MGILNRPTNIDFMGKRRVAVLASAVANVVIIVLLAIVGLNLGVDFAGGTVVEVRFNHAVSPAEVRQRAERAGLGAVQVQRIGAADENSYVLRMGGVTQLTDEKSAQVRAALEGLGQVSQYDVDLNNGLVNVRFAEPRETELLEKAVEGAGVGVSEVRSLGPAVTGGHDYQLVASGVSEQIFNALAAGLETPDFIRQRTDFVGPQVGRQLRNRGIMAVLYAMFAILVYVAFRFDFKFGPGALVAMVHDVLMTVGFYVVTRAEFNLTAIAALLTVVGYSVNDTIVIYDRVREEMARFKGKPLPEIINISVNMVLTRSILTSGTTALSLCGLIIFTGGELRSFALAMLVGIIVGTYSSIYIASPLTIWLDERAAAKGRRTSPQGVTT
jgi:preprotein translocase subunit SecF